MNEIPKSISMEKKPDSMTDWSAMQDSYARQLQHNTLGVS